MANRFSSSCRRWGDSLGRTQPLRTVIKAAVNWQRATDIQFKGWLALYLIAAGILTHLAKSALYISLIDLYPNLMPAFHSDAIPTPNVDFVNFAALIFTSLGATALYWLRQDYAGLFRLPLPHPLVIAVLALLCLVAFPSYISILTMSCAFLLALGMMLPGNGQANTGHAGEHQLQTRGGRNWFGFFTDAGPALPRIFIPLLALPVVLAVLVSLRAWYPLTLPNDYYEVEDIFHTHAIAPFTSAKAPATLDRSEVVACLKEEYSTAVEDRDAELVFFGALIDEYPFASPYYQDNAAHCPLGFADKLMPTTINLVHQTGEWQAQLGRLLFHHSYVYVPARHLLTYGLTWEVPMLYGIGQTAFYTGMMKLFGTSLADYFNYYFIGVFLGIAWITGIIYAITRSALAAACAFMVCTGCFYAITFEGTFLSAGFTPIRFAGIAFQLASVLYLFRRQNMRGMLLNWLALTTSFLWNSEFAIIGIIGQLLAALAPALRVRPATRFSYLAVLVITLGASIVLKGIAEHNLFQNNGYGIFSIGTKSIMHWQFEILLLCIAAGVAVLSAGLSRFPPAAAQARLALLPVLALMMIKFVFTASPLHLYTTLSFVLPFALIYFPYWHSSVSWPTGFGNRTRHPYISLNAMLLLATAGFFLFHSFLYDDGARHFRNAFARPFVTGHWNSLHDTIKSPVPEAVIASRVSALKSMLRPQDTVLILSPFDHILSFYVTPKRYCGNFEMLSNLVTRAQLTELAECALHTPNILVVYDDTLEIPCPPPGDEPFTDAIGCRGKMLAKQSLTLLRDKLSSYLTKVGQNGNLSFYRLKPAPAS